MGAMLQYEDFTTGGREMAMASSKNYRLLRKQGCAPRKASIAGLLPFASWKGRHFFIATAFLNLLKSTWRCA